MTVKIKELTIKAIINTDRSSNNATNNKEEQNKNDSLAKKKKKKLHKQRENRER
mgnify:CR=1 FL=1